MRGSSSKSGKFHAVITGDVVGSSHLSGEARRALYDVMKRGAEELQTHFGRYLPADLDLFAGDTWQLLVNEPARALRIGVWYRAYLRANAEGIDTRLAIAMGKVDYIIQERVSESEGEAFQLSGRLLSDKDGGPRMHFAAPCCPYWRVWDVAFSLIDALIQASWTPARSLAVTGALLGWPQDRILTLWDPPIRQPSVAEHLRRAHWPLLSSTITTFEQDLSEPETPTAGGYRPPE